MMAGEIQEPLNLSLLENSIHSGSVSFGRFEKEVLSWEKRSSFSHNRYLEEAERFSKPGSVTQMRAHFEAHFKKKGIQFPSPVEAQTWGQVAQHHHQTASEKDEELWESMSQYSHNSSYQDKCDKEKSQFGDSCVSYESYDDQSSLSVALEKTKIGCSERSQEEKVERVSSAPVTKKAESITPLATNKFRSKNYVGSAIKERATTNGFISRSNERVGKIKEENVEAIVRKALNFKARIMPKSTQARPQHTSKGQEKVREDAQDQHSSKASCDRSLANGAAKSKLNINKQKADTQKSLSGTRPNSSDQTARNNANRRRLAVRRSAVEVLCEPFIASVFFH